MPDRTPRATDTDGLLLGELAPGARVGEYLVERSVPTRGTGHLYEAVHRVLPRRVTLKVLPVAQPWNSALAVQLLREACIVEALDHPGIPRIYECGTLANHRPWVATEIVVGQTLAQLIATGALSVIQVVTIVRDVAETLAYAHARGLVHRAVSPQAIVFPPGARRFPLCLVDWSAARTRDSTTPLPFAPRLAVAPYLAPEQLRGADTDDRGDVFALGMVARELIDTIGRAGAPPVLAAMVRRMTDRDPAARPGASEVRELLGWLAAQLANEVAIPEPIDGEVTELMSRAFAPET